MNSPMPLFVIPLFLLVQVQSATIPINNGDPDGGERLQDLSQRQKKMDEATRNLLIAGEKIEELQIGRSPRFHRLNELRVSNPSRKTKRCPRYYLDDIPNFQKTLVGATLKKNFKKLCEQCRQSPFCGGKKDCIRCVRYCEPDGMEFKREDAASSMEEVGIAREPENDFTQPETIKDMTLVSRSAPGNEMSVRMNEDGNFDREPSSHLQMIHENAAGEEDKTALVGNQREPEEDRDDMAQQKEESRYYTASVISPGLLMNIILKLINFKQTADMEKVVILIKSRKPITYTAGQEAKIDEEFLKMFGKELETAQKIHKKSPLGAREINKILETAYEKAEFKSRGEQMIVKESVPQFNSNDKMSTSFNTMDPAVQSIRRQNDDINDQFPETTQDLNQLNPIEDAEAKQDEFELPELDASQEEDNENSRIPHHKKYKVMKKGHSNNYGTHHGYTRKSENQEDSNKEVMTDTMQQLSAVNDENLKNEAPNVGEQKLSKNSNGRTVSSNQMDSVQKEDINNEHLSSVQELHPQSESMRNRKAKQEEMEDSDEENLSEENEDSRTLHYKKYKLKKKKKGQMYSYSNHGMYNNGYGYSRNNDNGLDEAMTGDSQQNFMEHKVSALAEQNAKSLKTDEHSMDSQRDILGSPNEDMRTEDNLKNLQYKGQEDGLNVKSAVVGDDIIGSQQESTRPLNEDLIGLKDDFQRDQKGFNIKKLGDLLKVPTKSHNLKNNEAQARSKGTSESPKNEEAEIRVTDQNKKLDPAEVAISSPIEDNHDGMPGPFHSRIHAHFGKVQEYFKNKLGRSSEAIDSVKESINQQEPEISSEMKMNARTQEIRNLEHLDTEKQENKKGSLTDFESSEVKVEPIINGIPQVGINFQPEDLINLQMAENKEGLDDTEKTPNIGAIVDPKDLIILQEKNRDLTEEPIKNLPARPSQNTKKEFSTSSTDDNEISDKKNYDKPWKRPLFTKSDKNLPGQKIIQVDDQLIDVPEEDKSYFEMNSQPLSIPVKLKTRDSMDKSINQPLMNDDNEKVAVNNFGQNQQLPTDQFDPNLRLSVNGQDTSVTVKHPLVPSFEFRNEKMLRPPKIVYTSDGERSSIAETHDRVDENSEFLNSNINPMGKNSNAADFEGPESAKEKETDTQDNERLSTSENHEELAFPLPNKIQIKKFSTAPAYVGSPSPKIIRTDEKGSEKSADISDKEIVGKSLTDYENAIEEKIEKLITPREQEFLHNFGKIVPAIEKMHLNSKSDIFFMGNGIKLPLKMSPNKDGSISLSVDIEKLCECKNSTCAKNMDMINKLDENIMEMTNDLPNPEDTQEDNKITDNNIPVIVNTSEKKIRKPRNHMDLSQLYRTYKKKYHRLHRRSISNEYLENFKIIEQNLEKKLDQLNKNVKKSNNDYDNMLRKGTKDLLQIKEEDQIVKQRIDLVNDLLQWMKEMASVTEVKQQ